MEKAKFTQQRLCKCGIYNPFTITVIEKKEEINGLSAICDICGSKIDLNNIHVD